MIVLTIHVKEILQNYTPQNSALIHLKMTLFLNKMKHLIADLIDTNLILDNIVTLNDPFVQTIEQSPFIIGNQRDPQILPQQEQQNEPPMFPQQQAKKSSLQKSTTTINLNSSQ